MLLSDMELKFRLEFPDLNVYTHVGLQHNFLLGEFPMVPLPEEQDLHQLPSLSLQKVEYHQFTLSIPLCTDHHT